MCNLVIVQLVAGKLTCKLGRDHDQVDVSSKRRVSELRKGSTGKREEAGVVSELIVERIESVRV